MKKIITILTLILSTNAFAEITQEKMTLCKKVKEDAEAIMEGRQMEMSIVTWYEWAGDNKFYMKMINNAYDLGAMQLPENQAKQIREFGNKYFLICFKAYSK